MSIKNSLIKLFGEAHKQAPPSFNKRAKAQGNQWEADYKIDFGDKSERDSRKSRDKDSFVGRGDLSKVRERKPFIEGEASKELVVNERLRRIKTLRNGVSNDRQNYNPRMPFSNNVRTPRDLKRDSFYPREQHSNNLVLMA